MSTFNHLGGARSGLVKKPASRQARIIEAQRENLAARRAQQQQRKNGSEMAQFGQVLTEKKRTLTPWAGRDPQSIEAVSTIAPSSIDCLDSVLGHLEPSETEKMIQHESFQRHGSCDNAHSASTAETQHIFGASHDHWKHHDSFKDDHMRSEPSPSKRSRAASPHILVAQRQPLHKEPVSLQEARHRQQIMDANQSGSEHALSGADVDMEMRDDECRTMMRERLPPTRHHVAPVCDEDWMRSG